MVLAFVLWVLGIASILYFGIYAAVIGLNNSFTYFWLLLGLMFVVAGTVSWLCHHDRLHLPRAVSICLIVCMVVFFGVFGTAECLII